MNEPVAWAREDGVIAFFEKPEVDKQGFKWFPLYTHPAKTLKQIKGINYWVDAEPKTLTDEEIYACFHQYFVLGEPKPTHYELEYEDLIEFARAILRKAQEK